MNFCFKVTSILLSANIFNLDQSKNFSFGAGITRLFYIFPHFVIRLKTNPTNGSHFSCERFQLYPKQDLIFKCLQTLLKTLREKKKLLIKSKFSFSHSVFYLFGELCSSFNKFEIVVCKTFQFGRV